MKQPDQKDMYRISHSKQQNSPSSQSAHETYSRTGRVLCHRSNLNKCKSIEITKKMLIDHSGIKLEISNRKKLEKLPNIMKIKLNPTHRMGQKCSHMSRNTIWGVQMKKQKLLKLTRYRKAREIYRCKSLCEKRKEILSIT